MDLNLLNKVSGSSFMDEKNMVGMKESIDGQLDSSADHSAYIFIIRHKFYYLHTSNTTMTEAVSTSFDSYSQPYQCDLKS